VFRAIKMIPIHPFVENLSTFKFGAITREIALDIFEYYGIIGKKTDQVICICGSTMIVSTRGQYFFDFSLITF
jgi:hypothetical protein